MDHPSGVCRFAVQVSEAAAPATLLMTIFQSLLHLFELHCLLRRQNIQDARVGVFHQVADIRIDLLERLLVKRSLFRFGILENRKQLGRLFVAEFKGLSHPDQLVLCAPWAM